MIKKSEIKSLKFIFSIFSIAYCVLSIAFTCEAKEITILYTGESHAMLYPCNCPIEPDGGVSRRGALIKELRKANKNILLLDSGGFFAGGLMDENTQNTQLDIERTKVNLKAMEIMKYDAVNIGDDEFNFGREFFESSLVNNAKIPSVSCNIKPEKIPPFVIKDFQGTKIGVIGSCGVFSKQKAGGLEIIDPKVAIKKAITDLKKENVAIIVLLSHQGESNDLNLVNGLKGIDILILGHSRSNEEPVSKVGSTLFLRPSWEARRLGKLSITIENNKIVSYKAEELRLSNKISDDHEVSSILPRCFSDFNCKKSGFIGACQKPGQSDSSCLFTKAAKIDLSVIAPKKCKVCNTEPVINYLKKRFPGLSVSFLYYPDKEAEKLINDLEIKVLPAFLFSKMVEKEIGFTDDFRKTLESKGTFYMLKPQFTGISYILGRKTIKGKLDMFISLFEPYASDLLELAKEYNPIIHFLAAEKEKNFIAARGVIEVEEYLRGVCVQKYFPGYFYDYIICRAKSISSSWWENCAISLDKEKISSCARGKEGVGLLKDNISLNKEIYIAASPAFLVDNKDLFGIQDVPKKEEFRKILK